MIESPQDHPIIQLWFFGDRIDKASPKHFREVHQNNWGMSTIWETIWGYEWEGGLIQTARDGMQKSVTVWPTVWP